MLLLTVTPVDHAEPGRAQQSAIFVNGNGIWNGFWSAAVHVKVDKRADVPFLAKLVSGIVVMGGIQTDVPDGDIWVDRLKFAQGDDGADAVVPPGVEETDVEREISADICIV